MSVRHEMPHLKSEQIVEVRVEFRHFCLQEADEDFVPVEYPDGRDADDAFLTPYEGRVDVRSAGHTHTATLTAQVWQHEPPAEHEQWDVQGDTELYSETGHLSLLTCGGPMLDSSIDLGTPRVRWRVRVYSAGREEVAWLATQCVPEGVERYLAQFWPAARQGACPGTSTWRCGAYRGRRLCPAVYATPRRTAATNTRHWAAGNTSTGPSGHLPSRTGTAPGTPSATSMQFPPLPLL